MHKEHQIIALVEGAKNDMQKSDALIRSYIPFIRAEASKFMPRVCTEQDDEYSIAMIAFHEAIRGYSKEKGAFFSYAALLIKSRLIDYQRKEARHQGHISIYETNSEEDQPLHEQLADEKDHYSAAIARDATREEIAELARVMADFGISLTDVADNCPKQSRTLAACGEVVRYATAQPDILDELLATKKLPMTRLASSSGVSKKTLERHRKYILAMLLIQTNGYEIIRGHIKHVLKGGASA